MASEPDLASPTDPLESVMTSMLAIVPRNEAASLAGMVGADAEEDLFANRQEWKYLLDAEQAGALRSAIAPRLQLEEFLPGRRKTLMHSIYFDSDDFKLYRRAQRSQSNLKFRLRAYATHQQAAQDDLQGFFECKIGNRRKKHKLRAMLPLNRAGDLLFVARLATMATGRLSIAADQRFLRKARRVLLDMGMSPRLTVSYVREAFVDQTGQLRVTFDEHYTATRIDAGASSALVPGPQRLPGVIVELKFIGALPAWLQEVLLGFALAQGGVSFSKFRQGVALTYPDHC